MSRSAKASWRQKAQLLEKVVDQTSCVPSKRSSGIFKEEVWFQGDSVAKYSLAYINPTLCAAD